MSDNEEKYTYKEIEPKQWGRLASYLIGVENSMSWGATHNSFSQWVAGFSKDTKKSEASLWRALAAGRYYNELCSQAKHMGMIFPSLDDSDLAASPECLELYGKLSRAAPAELTRSLLDKVMKGHVSRSELRKLWDAYRPVLEGQTARGRNVVAPRFNPGSISMLGLRLEANCISALVQSGPLWLGVEKADIYKVIQVYVTGKRFYSLSSRSAPDAIVLFRSNQISDLELHGIDVLTTLEGPTFDRNEILRRYKANALGVDYLWIALPTSPDDRLSRKIPDGVGIMIADPDGINVIRGPVRVSRDPVQTELLLRELLARVCGS